MYKFSCETFSSFAYLVKNEGIWEIIVFIRNMTTFSLAQIALSLAMVDYLMRLV